MKSEDIKELLQPMNTLESSSEILSSSTTWLNLATLFWSVWHIETWMELNMGRHSSNWKKWWLILHCWSVTAQRESWRGWVQKLLLQVEHSCKIDWGYVQIERELLASFFNVILFYYLSVCMEEFCQYPYGGMLSEWPETTENLLKRH